MPRLIYLDQNKWVELAQAVHGKGDPRIKQIVEFLRETKRHGLSRFPLSFAHFIETNKRRDPESRQRLGSFMWELSDNDTLAWPGAILRWELDRALSRTLNRKLKERPFSLLGKGIAHAIDRPESGVKLDPNHDLPENTRSFLEGKANILLNKSLLTGKTPWGAVPNKPDLSGPAKRFAEGLMELRTKLTDADQDLQRRAVCAHVMCDILDDFNAALLFHDIRKDEFSELGIEGWTDFLESMPSVRIQIHLRWQWTRNRQLRPRNTDLNDWSYVATAAAYCDVVVTENQLADLLNRPLKKKATVITNLWDLVTV